MSWDLQISTDLEHQRIKENRNQTQPVSTYPFGLIEPSLSSLRNQSQPKRRVTNLNHPNLWSKHKQQNIKNKTKIMKQRRRRRTTNQHKQNSHTKPKKTLPTSRSQAKNTAHHLRSRNEADHGQVTYGGETGRRQKQRQRRPPERKEKSWPERRSCYNTWKHHESHDINRNNLQRWGSKTFRDLDRVVWVAGADRRTTKWLNLHGEN